MTNLIHIDFVKRQVSTKSNAARKVDRIDSLLNSEDIFERFDGHIEGLKARLGSDHEFSFPNYKTAKMTIDTYGFGCVHNSIHQWMPKDRTKTKWNDPFPMPCDLRAIDDCLKRNAGRIMVLGHKSDPFMWMDHKYSITKSVLELANKYKVQFVINTMSDLCGHDDYATLIAYGKHDVVMQMGFDHLKFQDNWELERYVSPGAPSIQRRKQAIEKLEALGVTVRREYTDLRELIKDKSKLDLLCRRTGTGRGHWTGEVMP